MAQIDQHTASRGLPCFCLSLYGDGLALYKSLYDFVLCSGQACSLWQLGRKCYKRQPRNMSCNGPADFMRDSRDPDTGKHNRGPIRHGGPILHAHPKTPGLLKPNFEEQD